jgi:N-acetylneuraminate synthase
MIGHDKVFIVAEAGVNHNGSLDLARRLVDVAADAGADAVKFQSFRAEALASADADMAAYQQRNTGTSGSQLAMLKALELSSSDHESLVDYCRARDIAFMSTAFDLQSLKLVIACKPPVLKIASGDVTATPLVLETARARLPIILSTGMCSLADIEQALGTIAYGLLESTDKPGRAAFADAFASAAGQQILSTHVTVLHCVTEYPAPPAQINLRAMDTLADAFGLPVGYSDHCLGTSVSVAAVARGARVIEKHITLDRAMPGPDHLASLEPADFTRMVADIRDVEACLGSGRKYPRDGEIANRTIARRSLVARQSIQAGEQLTAENISFQRPGDGIAPMFYWEMLGRVATRAYAAGERLEW